MVGRGGRKSETIRREKSQGGGSSAWSYSGAPEVFYLINPQHIFNPVRGQAPRVKGCTLITHLSTSECAAVPYNPHPPKLYSHSMSSIQTAGAMGYQKIGAGM